MPFFDAFGIDYGKNDKQSVGDALDDLYLKIGDLGGAVDLYADLALISPVPDAGTLYWVRNDTSVKWWFNFKPRGFYIWTGLIWDDAIKYIKFSQTTNQIEPLWQTATVAGASVYAINTMINYGGLMYLNLTGVNTDTAPSTDTTNWRLMDFWIIDGDDLKMITPRNIDLQNKALKNVEYIQYDITQDNVPAVEGKAVWNDTDGTLNIGLKGGNVNLQVGQELVIRAKAIGSAIDNGQVVYVSGASGNNPEMTLARSDLKTTSDCTIAMATEDVAENQHGYFTTFGKVREIDTDGMSAGSIVYLSDSVAGAYTTTPPTAPSRVIKVGIVLNESITEGVINVCIQFYDICLDREITQDPTGFSTPDDVIVTGDGTARTITLTGTVEGYWHGLHVPVLVSGWESDPHLDDTNEYYLIYDGSTFQWVTQANFKFYYLLIAYTFYAVGTNERVYSRECHGLMPWESHSHFHEINGTVRQSGGDLADYVLSSTTATDRRPSVSSTSIDDEDLKTINLLLASDSNYTQSWLDGAGADTNWATIPVDIVPLSTARPYWNEFTGGAWQQTLMSNNYFMSIWAVAIPVASDVPSQKYRYIWIQGQSQSLTISAQQALTFADLNKGDLIEYAPEFTPFKQIIIKYTAANWTFQEVVDLTGTLNAQVGSPAGNFLTAVTTDTTLTGDGTATTPLGIALSNVNIWTGKQTFPEINVSDNFVVDGEYVDMYEDGDSTYPARQFANLAHNEISDAFDCYYDGSNWRSSALDSNFIISKSFNSLDISYNQTTAVGSTFTPTLGWQFTDTGVFFAGNLSFSVNTISSTDTNGNINIIPDGTGNVNMGGTPTTDVQKLGVVGSVGYYIPTDLVYPVLQNLNFAHDNINFSFDAYFDGSKWKSSDAGSNFLMTKSSDLFRLLYESGISAGNDITWDSAFATNTLGEIFMYQVYSDGVSGGRDLYIQSSGQITYNTSSRESKINIEPLENWQNIYNLEPVQYNNRLKDNDGNYLETHDEILDRGLIADDVEAYYSEIVYKDISEEGEKIVGLDYKKLIPDLIKCIQDLQARIIVLEKQ